MKTFSPRANDANIHNPEPLNAWVAHVTGDHWVTITKTAAGYEVAETRRTATGWAGVFHGTCSTFKAAEAAGLRIAADRA